jgi:hypothetical protein
MAERLTRRRFARLAIAGGVAAGSIGVVTAPFANTIFARPADPPLIGIGVAPIAFDDTDAAIVNRTEFEPASGSVVSSARASALLVHSIELSTGQVRSVRSVGVLADGRTAALETNELITGSALLRDGTLVVALTPASGSPNQKAPTRLTRSAASAATVPLIGLASGEMLADLLVTRDNRLMGLVTQRSGAAPADLVNVDLQSGRFSRVGSIALAGYWRINTLTQSASNQFYATAINRNGETHLIRVNADGSQPSVIAALSYGGIVWNNGLQNLVSTSSDELIAFGAMRYETVNTLYRVDPRSGEMTRLYDFDAASVAAAPA